MIESTNYIDAESIDAEDVLVASVHSSWVVEESIVCVVVDHDPENKPTTLPKLRLHKLQPDESASILNNLRV